MSEYQEQLNRGARQTRRMVNEAIAAADDLCQRGDFDGSAQAWAMARDLCAVMATGRAMNVGGITAKAGDK